ncbi:MAG TPA: DUF6529 family protein [Propionicimonas sp.]|jgi:hypothetical protein
MTTPPPDGTPTTPAAGGGTRLLLIFILIGAAIAVALGVYGRVHEPSGNALFTLGFPSLIWMKVTLATAAMVLAIVQVFTALRMFGRIGHAPVPRATVLTHRFSGVLAVILSLPVAFHCLWSLGFGTYDTRVLVHSLLGCAFYGVFVTKMLALRSRRMPGWALPWLGGALFTAMVVVWLTSAAWFFANGAPDY